MKLFRSVIVFFLALELPVSAAKLIQTGFLDRDHIVVTYSEGDVVFKDDGQGAEAYKGHSSDPNDNRTEWYGVLDTEAAAQTGQWTITSPDDPDFGTKGRTPSAVYRKSKINGMAQLGWDGSVNDWKFETPLLHTLYLRLPAPLKEGKTYVLSIGKSVDKENPSRKMVFDIFQSRSEAIHVNLVGFMEGPSAKSADLYHWMGDGKTRDYSSFERAKVWLYDVASGSKQEAGTVQFWKKRGRDYGGHDLTGSDVWIADFTPPASPGTYRLAVEGVGCSQDFEVRKAVYAEPFKVSVKGFYYMRIGEPVRTNIHPVPRQPRYIPGVDPAGFKVILTTMQPFHPEWKTFSRGDTWDKPADWARFAKEGQPENPNAWGGHSDALDWDRHLGHVSIIYDMLYPYFLTGGALKDDDTGIAESGNGIPDILDEARNEVDFWLRLRDGEAYSHGLTNPFKDQVMYQAGPTTIAAWANAANAAMLADCFRIAGLEDLRKEYLAHAVTAWKFASKQKDQQLDKTQGVGDGEMRGADFKMTAAAFLFNLTGDKRYEKAVAELSRAETETSDLGSPKIGFQIWATAGYLLSPRKRSFPDLAENMKKSVIHHARVQETGQTKIRPSRRASDQSTGWFHTVQNVHRTMLAHRISEDPIEKAEFLDALIREADWGLGRNPMNLIQMTTAATPLERFRSIENAYTSGRNDGTPGLHPGHTPYLNLEGWGGNMAGSNPRWMANKGYPAPDEWPRGEIYYNTRWVWAHSEFTPQQTMRGKMALYGYLYGIDR